MCWVRRTSSTACGAAGVHTLIYTSSGAAYGYHADNPEWLDESDPLRGNAEFAYADHKRLVEEMLARWRATHPELRQLIFRPGTILGARAHNQITALFDRSYVLGLSGAQSPFVIIWDQDVVGAILQRHPWQRDGDLQSRWRWDTHTEGNGASDAQAVHRAANGAWCASRCGG